MTFLPGAILDPGAHWNGQAGWVDPRAQVWHYTVGRNSIALIRNQGLAATLVRTEGIYEFAPLEAVCFTQCEWNRVVMGDEVESLDGSIDDAQLLHLQYLTLFKLTTFSIPPNFYDGPRLPVGTVFYGVTNHRNLIHRACDMHSDGFDEWVWQFVISGALPPTPEDDMTEDDWNRLNARFDAIDLRLVYLTFRPEGGPGLNAVRWWGPGNVENMDVIGIDDTGSVFTTSGLASGHVFFISGPRAQLVDGRPRTQEPSALDQTPIVLVNHGQLRFRTQAQGGPDGEGTGTIEHYWNPADTPGADGSRWGSYAVA